MRDRWWFGIAAALVLAAPHAYAQQTRAIVIEAGQRAPAQLERLRTQMGAGEIDPKEPNVWLVSPEEDERVRAQLRSQGLRVRGAAQDFFSILAPIDASAADAQRAQLAELARGAETRVSVLRAQLPQLTEMAFSGELAARMAEVFPTDAASAGRRPAFNIELGDGRTFAFARDFSTANTWSGSSADAVGDFVYANGVISGRIQTATTVIDIVPLGENLYAGVEAPRMAASEDDSADLPAAPDVSQQPRAECTAKNPCVIRVGVVYSREAALAAGANARHVLAVAPMQELNASLEHAGLEHEIRFELFSSVLVLDPNEPQRASVRDQSDRLVAGANSWEREVHAWREENDVDMVAMIGRWIPDPSKLCGKAGEVGFQRAELAYVVINYSTQCELAFTFGHELGHLLGMAHDRRTRAIQTCHRESPPPPGWCAGFPAPPPQGANRAAFLQQVADFCSGAGACQPPGQPILGYCFQAAGATYGTMLSYPFNCAPGGLSRLWWSNPSYKYPGTAVGLGDAYANQQSLLLHRARFVSRHSEYLD